MRTKVNISEEERQKNTKAFVINERNLIDAIVKSARAKYGRRSSIPSQEHLRIDGFEIRIDTKKKHPDIPLARFGAGEFLAPHRTTGLFPMDDLMVQLDMYLEGIKAADVQRKTAAKRHSIAREKLLGRVQVDEFVTFVKLDKGICTISPMDGMVRFELKFDPSSRAEFGEIINLLDKYRKETA